MYLSYCTLFLLALVACQAAPSPSINEKAINEAETTFGADNLKLEEGTGAEKDRAKKSTTFCVEVHSGKEQRVPCSNKQEISVLQPAVSVIPSQPSVSNLVYQQPQPQSVYASSVIAPAPAPAPQQIQVIQVPSQPQPQPQPQPQRVIITKTESAPAPLPTNSPVINIVPASLPCSQTAPQLQPAPQPQPAPQLQPAPQPQPHHTVHVIHPQLPQPESKLKNIQEETRYVEPRPRPYPYPQHTIVPYPLPAPAPAPCKSDILVVPNRPVEWIIPSEQPQPIEVLPSQEETYECNCRPEYHTRSRHGPLLTKSYPPMAAYGPVPAKFLAAQSSVMDESHSPVVLASQGVKETEGRHHKHKIPTHLSVQFPVIYGPGNDPAKYYNSNSYSYPYTPHESTYTPSTYYGNYGTYGTYPTQYYIYPEGSYNSYPYDSASSITVNAGGPFYRSQYRNSQESSMNGKSQESLSPAFEVIDLSNNKKRAADQSKNDVQNETIPMEKEGTVKEIPKTNEVESTK